MQEIVEIFKETIYKLFIPLTAFSAAIIAIWAQFEIWSILLGALIFILCLLITHHEIIKPKYLDDPQKIIDVLTNYLKKTHKSLYYFGGAGFIGESKIWRNVFAQKLQDSEVKIVRLLDLKKPEELRPLLSKLYGENTEDEVEDYRRWLKTHAECIKKTGSLNNFFYSYEGAPIWKHGMNYIIFDKKIVAIVTPGIQIERRVIIIRSSKIAEAFIDSIESVVKQFKLESVEGQFLEDMCKENLE